jgi:alkylhydroperoxidase/carboxymuconolactone decarboxylase family protein YurZ
MARRPQRPAPPTPLTDQYIAEGEWNPLWDAVRGLDPEFVEAYLAFRSVPHRKGPLPPKFKELVLVAINVATTHLYAPGARRHMRNALKHGATAEELLEVIQLTTVMGIHSVNMAVPMLVEELEAAKAAKAGAAPKPAPTSAPEPVPAAPAQPRAPTRHRSPTR